MAKRPYYKVSTLPKKKLGLFSQGFKNKRRFGLIASIIGVYVMAGGLLGFFLFGSNHDPAKASDTAFISASLRLIDEDKLEPGKDVQLALTLQNTSVNESINSVFIDFYATKDAIQWRDATSQNITDPKPIPAVQNTAFSLPVLSSGERAEYLIKGVLKDPQLEFLTVLGRVKFLNKQGTQEVTTNRVFATLASQANNLKIPVQLGLEKDKYNLGNDILFKAKNTDPTKKVNGKIYVSNRATGEVATTLDCQFNDAGECAMSIKTLPVGDYSAAFIDESESIFSNVNWFSVIGQNKIEFKPSDQSSLELPFGSSSINGTVQIVARRVLSQNDIPNSSSICTFQAILDAQVAGEFTAPVEEDRNCRYSLNLAQMGDKAGVYTIKLLGTAQEKSVSFLPKPVSLLNVENRTTTLQKGQNVQLAINPSSASSSSVSSSVSSSTVSSSIASSIASSASSSSTAITNSVNATVFIYHTASLELQQINSINGNAITMINGKLNVDLPGSYFSKGGLYQVYIKMDDGKQTDFLNLSFNDSEPAFTQTGIMVDDYNKLKIGENITFKLDGITDRSGNLITQGSCQANIYTVKSTAVPNQAAGEIKDGKCQALLPAGKITKSGPILVSFTGANITSKINQSSQFELSPGNIDKYGEMNMEFEPIRQNYANKLIIGPVTDKYGNLIQSSENTLRVEAKGQIIKEFTNLSIVDGFAKIVIPSSLLSYGEVDFKLSDSQNKEVLIKKISPIETEDKLILPNLPDQLNPEDSLQIGVNGLVEKDATKCKLKIIKSNTESIEQSADYDNKDGKCLVEWKPNELRDNSQVLLQFTVGTQKFFNILKLNRGEAASTFSINPQIRLNSRSEAEVSLFTSPILDKYGQTVNKGEIKWQYNGKIRTTQIENGMSKLELTAKDFDTKDIRSNFDQRFLDLDLDVKAGITSISSTNNVNIFLGNKDIAARRSVFQLTQGSNYVILGNNQILKFTSDTCNVILTQQSGQTSQNLVAHRQGNTCLVQIEPKKAGDYKLLFEDKGFRLGTFAYTIDEHIEKIDWCKKDNKLCTVQVIAPTKDQPQAIIYDDDKQYQILGKSLDNYIELKQNGLNPLKKYLVEVKYTNTNDQQISHFKEFLGSDLLSV